MRRTYLLFAGLLGTGCPTSDTDTPPADGGAQHTDADSATPVGSAPSLAGDALPCEVGAVLERACASCHGATPQFGAPFSLVRASDLAKAGPVSGQPLRLAVAERIARTGAGRMPPAPQPNLSPDDQRLVTDWLARGAPAATRACTPLVGGLSADGGPPPAPDASSTASAPDAAVPPLSSDCEVGFELRAGSGTGAPFPVPLENDHYECFYFKADVGADVLATSLAPLLDDTRVLHHWLLFASDKEEAPSGSHARCDGIHPNSYLMASWLPGTPALVLPPDVGMEMPHGPTAQFILENHYNNVARYQGATDASGVKVCGTRAPKAQLAAIHWLGSERIFLAPNAMGSATATCTPAGTDPIHILGVLPHMHKLGRHARMTIQRKDGSSEVLHDDAFAFESQLWYPKQVLLLPGDRVSTQCDYQNTTSALVTLGENTTNEMCYMFTLAYPVGRMNTGGDYLNPVTGRPYVEGPNRCMR